jgi:hypothetical protein
LIKSKPSLALGTFGWSDGMGGIRYDLAVLIVSEA